MAAVERAAREDSALALVVQRAGVSGAEIEATPVVRNPLKVVEQESETSSEQQGDEYLHQEKRG